MFTHLFLSISVQWWEKQAKKVYHNKILFCDIKIFESYSKWPIKKLIKKFSDYSNIKFIFIYDFQWTSNNRKLQSFIKLNSTAFFLTPQKLTYSLIIFLAHNHPQSSSSSLEVLLTHIFSCCSIVYLNIERSQPKCIQLRSLSKKWARANDRGRKRSSENIVNLLKAGIK